MDTSIKLWYILRVYFRFRFNTKMDRTTVKTRRYWIYTIYWKGFYFSKHIRCNTYKSIIRRRPTQYEGERYRTFVLRLYILISYISYNCIKDVFCIHLHPLLLFSFPNNVCECVSTFFFNWCLVSVVSRILSTTVHYNSISDLKVVYLHVIIKYIVVFFYDG